MNIVYQTLNIVKDAIAYISKDNRNYYKFGETDCLPNEIVRAVNDSGTARSCITKLSQFIQANGTVDQVIGTSPANKEQSFNSAISDLSMIVSYFKCSSFRVLYNNSGMPAVIYPVPTQYLRRKGRTRFTYNELMGEPNYRRNEDKYLAVFDPLELPSKRLERIDRQIKSYGEQWGDIVYHFKKGIGLYQDVYSIPDYYSGIDDIESDAGISRLEKRNIQKGWRTPIIVSTGPIDKEVKDDQGKTEYDKFATNMKKFAGEDAAYALHLEGTTNEMKPTVTTINIADILDQTDKATDRVGRKVCRHMGVPPVLVGFSTPGQLGNATELQNTMELFKMTVIESQDLISESLKLVFPEKDWTLSTMSLWGAKTESGQPAEQLPGDPTAEVKTNEAMRSWGMADINKIQKIIKRFELGTTEPDNAKALTFEQAVQILKSYGLTDEDIDVWIVKPEEL